MKIACLPNTVLPIDERVIEGVQSNKYNPIALDADYLRLLPQFHGGVPTKPYFTAPNGEIRRIGWFVSFLDEQSPIPGPFEGGIHHDDLDTRVSDRSIPSVFAYDYNSFFEAERMYPFAALYTDGPPCTLLHYMRDFAPDDALCFDRSTDPQSVVLYSCEQADEVIRNLEDQDPWDRLQYDGDPWDEIDYDSFAQKIANSFVEFVDMLREEP